MQKLGKDSFGIVALAMSFNILTELLGRGVCLALTKYVVSETSKNHFDKANRLVNTSLIWLGACGFIGGVAYFVLAFYVDTVFNVPPALVLSARWVMVLMGFRVLLCFPFNTFQSVLFSHQRYDIANMAKSIAIVLRISLTILYFELFSTGLVELITITILTLLIERFIWIYSSFKISRELRFGVSFLSVSALRTLVSFGGVILVSHVANMVGYEAVKWVLGLELSVMDIGAYALIAQLAVFAGAMVRSIANVLMPVSSRYSALSLHEKNAQLAFLGTKYAMIISSFVCLAILFLIKPLLLLWVGKAYPSNYINEIALAGMVLLVGQWCISTTVCLIQILTGIGKMRVPAIVTLSWAIGGLLTVWISLHWFKGSLFTTVLIISIARTVGSIAHLFYGMAVLKVEQSKFIINAILRPGLSGFLVLIMGYFLSQFFEINRIRELMLSGIVLAFGYALTTWMISLTSFERNIVSAKLQVMIDKTKITM
ncbi:hypothetical protein KAR91_54455 [Candidatus Pacearchaeota archaeon]|nr:hypothetical protein [Candidatus Pacearchaeota archaeon]